MWKSLIASQGARCDCAGCGRGSGGLCGCGKRALPPDFHRLRLEASRTNQTGLGGPRRPWATPDFHWLRLEASRANLTGLGGPCRFKATRSPAAVGRGITYASPRQRASDGRGITYASRRYRAAGGRGITYASRKRVVVSAVVWLVGCGCGWLWWCRLCWLWWLCVWQGRVYIEWGMGGSGAPCLRWFHLLSRTVVAWSWCLAPSLRP